MSPSTTSKLPAQWRGRKRKRIKKKDLQPRWYPRILFLVFRDFNDCQKLKAINSKRCQGQWVSWLYLIMELCIKRLKHTFTDPHVLLYEDNCKYAGSNFNIFLSRYRCIIAIHFEWSLARKNAMNHRQGNLEGNKSREKRKVDDP